MCTNTTRKSSNKKQFLETKIISCNSKLETILETKKQNSF